MLCSGMLLTFAQQVFPVCLPVSVGCRSITSNFKVNIPCDINTGGALVQEVVDQIPNTAVVLKNQPIVRIFIFVPYGSFMFFLCR